MNTFEKSVFSMVFVLSSAMVAGTDFDSCKSLTAYDSEQDLYSHRGFGYEDYPILYEKCYMIHTTSQNKVVELESEDFQVEEEESCSHDYLQVTDPEKGKFVKYCGEGSFEIVSSSSYIKINFYSDQSITADGFHLKFKQTDYEDYESSQWINHNHNLSEEHQAFERWSVILFTFAIMVCVAICVIAMILAMQFRKRKARANNSSTGLRMENTAYSVSGRGSAHGMNQDAVHAMNQEPVYGMTTAPPSYYEAVVAMPPQKNHRNNATPEKSTAGVSTSFPGNQSQSEEPVYTEIVPRPPSVVYDNAVPLPMKY